jgi:hypothetical protein
MSKTKTAIILADGGGARQLPPLEEARVKADAMLRAALECCHQHDRYARLVERPALEAEHQAADEMCVVVTKALAEMAELYGQAAHKLAGNGKPDDDWWHRANALWHASREFGRRQTCCERVSRRATGRKPDTLGELVLQYDLEASALLALRQAAEAYRKARPEAA